MQYTSAGMLVKNKDEVSAEIIELMSCSSLELAVTLFTFVGDGGSTVLFGEPDGFPTVCTWRKVRSSHRVVLKSPEGARHFSSSSPQISRKEAS